MLLLGHKNLPTSKVCQTFLHSSRKRRAFAAVVFVERPPHIGKDDRCVSVSKSPWTDYQTTKLSNNVAFPPIHENKYARDKVSVEFKWGFRRMRPKYAENRVTIAIGMSYFKQPAVNVKWDELNEAWEVFWFDENKLNARPFPVRIYGLKQSKAKALEFADIKRKVTHEKDLTTPKRLSSHSDIHYDEILQCWGYRMYRDGRPTCRYLSAAKHGYEEARRQAVCMSNTRIFLLLPSELPVWCFLIPDATANIANPVLSTEGDDLRLIANKHIMSLFGNCLRVMTFGESHGVGVGCIVDGLPPGLPLHESDIQPQLNRRRPGQSSLTTPRQELDTVEILSGISDGRTLGTPIAMFVKNKDQRSIDYANVCQIPRPGHADYTYKIKYNGFVAKSGGGRASARETVARVAAGAVAEKWLFETYGTRITSWVSSVGNVDIPEEICAKLESSPPMREDVELLGAVGDVGNDNPNAMVYTRCPHLETAQRVAELIRQTKAEGDSVGGIVTCVATGVPVGLGEPCFDKIEAELAKAMLSLPATKGFEIGEGFRCTRMKGSEHNDKFSLAQMSADGTCLLQSSTNYSGGSLGGISSGSAIVFRVAFKAVSSISQPQTSLSYDGQPSILEVQGRHDPCILPRTPPLIESMTALVIADLALLQRARVGPAELPIIKRL